MGQNCRSVSFSLSQFCVSFIGVFTGDLGDEAVQDSFRQILKTHSITPIVKEKTPA